MLLVLAALFALFTLKFAQTGRAQRGASLASHCPFPAQSQPFSPLENIRRNLTEVPTGLALEQSNFYGASP